MSPGPIRFGHQATVSSADGPGSRLWLYCELLSLSTRLVTSDSFFFLEKFRSHGARVDWYITLAPCDRHFSKKKNKFVARLTGHARSSWCLGHILPLDVARASCSCLPNVRVTPPPPPPRNTCGKLYLPEGGKHGVFCRQLGQQTMAGSCKQNKTS